MGKRGPAPAGKVAAVPSKLPQRPRPPAGMTPRARARWRELVKGYPVDHFKAGDLPLLRAYCEAHDKAVRMQEALNTDGDFVDSAQGTKKAHPAHAIKLAAEQLMAQLATKLRMCANSRIDKRQAGKEKAEVTSSPGRKLFGGAS
jgi:P27 family predicted phage terminase small subunit